MGNTGSLCDIAASATSRESQGTEGERREGGEAQDAEGVTEVVMEGTSETMEGTGRGDADGGFDVSSSDGDGRGSKRRRVTGDVQARSSGRVQASAAAAVMDATSLVQHPYTYFGRYGIGQEVLWSRRKDDDVQGPVAAYLLATVVKKNIDQDGVRYAIRLESDGTERAGILEDDIREFQEHQGANQPGSATASRIEVRGTALSSHESGSAASGGAPLPPNLKKRRGRPPKARHAVDGKNTGCAPAARALATPGDTMRHRTTVSHLPTYVCQENETPRSVAKKVGMAVDTLIEINAWSFPTDKLLPRTKFKKDTHLFVSVAAAFAARAADAAAEERQPRRGSRLRQADFFAEILPADACCAQTLAMPRTSLLQGGGGAAADASPRELQEGDGRAAGGGAVIRQEGHDCAKIVTPPSTIQQLKEEITTLKEAEEQVQSRLAASVSTVTQQAGKIAEKERELLRLLETVNVMKRKSESEKEAMQAQMQQQATAEKEKELLWLRQQQASEIAEKEGELLRLRETVNAIKSESESEKEAMTEQIRQQAGEIGEKERESC